MKKLILAVFCGLFAVTGAIAAEPKGEAKKGVPAAEKKAEPAKKEPSEAQLKQQQRMKDCAGKAEGKKGDERKQFMSTCLKGQDAAPSKKETQQEKMKSCNAKAKDKKGDDRKKFMSECLKG